MPKFNRHKILRISLIKYLSLLIFTSSALATDLSKDVAIAINNSRLGELVESRECLAKAYILAIKGKISDNVCTYSDYLGQYLSRQVRYQYFLDNGKYTSAVSELEKLLEVIGIFPNELQNVKPSVLSQLKLLSGITDVDFHNFETFVVDRNFEAKVHFEADVFTVDTGAFFSSFGNFANSTKLLIRNFVGTTGKINFSILNTKKYKNLVFLNNDANYLGIQFLKNYKIIRFSQKKHRQTNVISFFQDGSNLIFNGDVETNGIVLRNINICVDTGSEASFLIDNKIDPLIEKLDFSSKSISWTTLDTASDKVTLRIAKLGILKVNEREIMGVNLVLHGYANMSCSLVLGRASLKNWLVEIDWQKKLLTFDDS